MAHRLANGGRLCYVSRNYKGHRGAGNKAKCDNEDTLALMGALNLGLKRTYHRNNVVAFLIDLAGIIAYFFSVRKRDVVFLQYPTKKYFTFMCRVAKWRGASTIVFIHDLRAFRRKRVSAPREIQILSRADYIIATNDVMAKWLKEQGLKRPCHGLGLHDYRSSLGLEVGGKNHSIPPKRIVYAGSIARRKNMFLTKIEEHLEQLEVHVFGRNSIPELESSRHLLLHPLMEPDDFIATVEGDFGLVWDGDSLTACTGAFGEYLEINTPHKASFYLRAGLPLIVWDRSAISSIIEREGIGISVNRIDTLEKRLNGIPEREMQEMRANVQRVASALAEGESMRRAVEKALEELRATQSA